MAQQQKAPQGRDLSQGVPIGDLPEGGMLVGHLGDDEVLLVRQGAEVFAIGAHCTHYQGPLAEGLVVDGSVRCPWHHACFDLRTGEAVRAPALSAERAWNVEQRDGRIVLMGRKPRPSYPRIPAERAPNRIVIVGGGGAGFAAAEMLRRRGYDGGIVMLSDDDAPPCDRPNLSKDYLAGTIPEDWVPLRPDSWYAENNIDLRLQTAVRRIDVAGRAVELSGGERIGFDRLLLATGAEPNRLTIPGADQPHVVTLRTLRDSRAIIARAESAKSALVLGASFIGLEVAASLRHRGLEVHVAAPASRPLEKVFGPELGDFVRRLHEEHGVIFHLGETADTIDGERIKLTGGGAIEAQLVVAGIGVTPRVQLAEEAGLVLDRGVSVDPYLETNAPGIFAAGDIARWPDPHTGERIRVEHWVVAERQGQTAARNMLGERVPYNDVPFFWSQHYDVPINYVGHAERWDALEIDGNVSARDCLARYRRGGRLFAVASVFRDLDCLKAEVQLEHELAA
jgi:NADPH-dependent 2,4-dienoyl-CoA reductase/sulfur reductase-like enzyme/nitrite reductase/ring-hydroxylating ferredoxin subunit